MALVQLSQFSPSCYFKYPPLSQTSSSRPTAAFSYSFYPVLFSPVQNSSFCALAIQSHKPKLVKPFFSRIKTTRSTVRNGKLICCGVSDSASNQGSQRPPRETILLPGCDYEHWLIVMEFPKDAQLSSDEMVETYIKTLAQVVGSEEEAKERIYALSTTTYTGFQARISEELSEKCKGLPGVLWVLPDSYIDVPNKDYGGDKFVDGKVIPRIEPKSSQRPSSPRRGGTKPQTFESRRYERRRDGPPTPQKNSTPETQQSSTKPQTFESRQYERRRDGPPTPQENSTSETQQTDIVQTEGKLQMPCV